ncbi:hypothetical protein ACLMJK_008533 [Lecanora helva]
MIAKEVNGHSSGITKHKKSKNKDVEKNEKKRKRHESDHLESTSRSKKQRSKHHAESIEEHKSQSKGENLVSEPPYYLQTSSLYLPLPPISQKHAIKGLCAEHLSPMILTYYPPFRGVILSYTNVHLCSDPHTDTIPAYSRCIDEYAASFVWVTADFLILKLQKGDVIEGWVNLQNESNIGLLCLNFFNATIERKRLAREWKWISGGIKPPKRKKLKKASGSSSSDSEEDSSDDHEMFEHEPEDTQGHFEDEKGKAISGLISFRVQSVETSRSMDRETSFLNIEGTMLTQEEEEELQKQEATKTKGKGKGKGKTHPRHTMAGALMNGVDGSMDIDHPVQLTPSLKHRAKY